MRIGHNWAVLHFTSPVLKLRTLLTYVRIPLPCNVTHSTGLRDLAKAIFGTQLSSLPYAPLQIPLVASFFLSLSVSFLFRLPFPLRTKVKHHWRPLMSGFLCDYWGPIWCIWNVRKCIPHRQHLSREVHTVYLLGNPSSFYQPLGKWQQNGKRPSHVASCLYLLHILFITSLPLWVSTSQINHQLYSLCLRLYFPEDIDET